MNAFGLKDAERVLIEDLFTVTLSDFKGDHQSPGRKRTDRNKDSFSEPQLKNYCEYFIRVLRAAFGQDKHISATIFQESTAAWLPFRLVAFELDRNEHTDVAVETMDMPNLLSELERLNKTWLKGRRKVGSIYYQRVVRIYDRLREAPTIFMIKPDAYRYWTRSMGLHDADQVTVDFARWQKVAANGGRDG